MALLVGVGLSLLLCVQQFLIKPFQIPSESMLPALKVGDVIVADRLTNHWSDPKVGDIVVFHAPARAETTDRCANPNAGYGHTRMCDQVAGGNRTKDPYIKRVVAVGGDVISMRGGKLIRNGKPQPGVVVACPDDPSLCDFPAPIRVPEGAYYLLGDNRPNSNDSRFWGPVERDQILGIAKVRVWPLNRIGSPHST